MSLTNESQFFDLHTSGIGYVNRVREVTVRKGKPFMACDIAALRGDAKDVEYTRFDCKVSGEEATQLIRRCQKAVNDKRKVIIGFRIGDIYAETFTYSSGDKAGQAGVSLKGRLLFISFMKIDGVEVYKAKPRDGDQQSGQQTSVATPVTTPPGPSLSYSRIPLGQFPVLEERDNDGRNAEPGIDEVLASYGH